MSNTKTVMGQAANTQGIPLDITDVFSTYLYEGNGSTQTITNGIDLDGEGGIVWIKKRLTTENHALFDTERGVNKDLESNDTDASNNLSNSLTAFNSNGFSLGDSTVVNNGDGGIYSSFVSWTFRKAPKFFDVVTYTGDGVNDRAIPHNLDGEVGTIFIKRTDAAENWYVYHRSEGNTQFANLNTTGAFQAGSYFPTPPTSTDFYLGSGAQVNGGAKEYVAYLFAHNDGDGGFNGGDIIKCGSYTGTDASGNQVDLGFEPQFVMVKSASTTGNWGIFDTMRGFTANAENQQALFANDSSDELTNGKLSVNATGFALEEFNYNSSPETYIYIAIRRGTKVPESATEVFAPVAQNTTSTPLVTTGFPVDLAILTSRSGASRSVVDRLRGSTESSSQRMFTNTTNAETSSGGGLGFDNNTGYKDLLGGYSDNILWNWKRAPGFFDVVAYTGDGASLSHNLSVVPNLIIVKNRGTGSWRVTSSEANGVLYLDSNDAANGTSGFQTLTPCTSSTMNLSGVSQGGDNIAYLFASLPGISKVGSYTGNGTSQTIDCGFTSGARFVLIKNASESDNWYVFDTERGIVSGADPYLRLNLDLAEQSEDFIDPASSGFSVSGSDPGNNKTGNTYIFYAIA